MKLTTLFFALMLSGFALAEEKASPDATGPVNCAGNLNEDSGSKDKDKDAPKAAPPSGATQEEKP